MVFSAALHPARDKVPRRTDFPLRRAPPYFLSIGQENVREPHSPWLFFAQMVKRHACGFFFVLFLSAKKKDKGFLPFPKGETMFFSCSPGKRTKRMRDRSGRSDLCEGFAFTRCSRHVFAQASLCKPRRNTQRDNKVHLLFFAPAGARKARRLCLPADAAVLFCIRLFQIESMISDSRRISVLRPFRSAYRMVFHVPPFSSPFHTAKTRSDLSTIYEKQIEM